jgi:hypothetical protein
MVNSGAALRIGVKVTQNKTQKDDRGAMVRKVILAVMALAMFALPVSASLPNPSAPIKVTATPRSDDGAEYVWTVFCRSGLTYSYIPASQFPLSPRFEEVAKPQTGDIAWWPEYVAIYVAQNSSVITRGGYSQVASLGGGGPRFFRMRVSPGEAPSNNAPGACERNLL